MKRWHLTELLKVMLALSIVTWLLASGRIDLYAIRYILRPESLLISWGAVFISYILVSARWQKLLASQEILVSFRDAFRLSLIGGFFSFVLPGGVSGDAIKAYYVSRDAEQKRWSALVSVVVDRYIGVFSLCGVALVAAYLSDGPAADRAALASIRTFLTLIFAFIAVFGFFVFSPFRYAQAGRWIQKLDIRVGEKARLFFDALHSYGRSQGTLFHAIVLSVVGHAVIVCLFVHMAEKMGEFLPLSLYFHCVPIALMLTAIPIAPGGIGVGQAAFYFIFNLYLGRQSDLGPTLITVYQLILFSYGLVGAYFYLKIKERVKGASLEATSQN